MTELPEEDVPESPATWENELVGEATELLGKAMHSKDVEKDGEAQKEIAHEVRERYDDEQHRS